MGAQATTESIAQTLQTLVDPTAVQPWPHWEAEQQALFQRSLAPATEVAAQVTPTSPSELAAVMTCLHQQRWPSVVMGHGSKLDWGGLVQSRQPIVAVRTAGLNRLIEHAVGDLTVTVEAGMPFAQLQTLLATAGQFLPIDPAFPAQATIGGIVATADTGSLRQRYNSVRDLLLGVTFVRSDGQVAKAGGRVVKNVAGYDLMKLLTGAYGTLGILSQVTFRVYPLPEASQTIVVTGEAEAIAAAAQTLLNSALTPIRVDILSAAVMQGLDLGSSLGLVVQFQGIPANVQAQTSRLIEVGQALGLTSRTEKDDAALWQRLSEQMTATVPETTVTCKIGIRATEAVNLLTFIATLTSDGWVQIHAGSGLGRLQLTATDANTLAKIRQFCQTRQGFLSIQSAPIPLKQAIDVWGYEENALDLMRRIKQQFDPDTLLNPCRFVGGI